MSSDVIPGWMRTLNESGPRILNDLLALAADFRAAAGELRVPLPDPGSIEAKMLAANIILRRDNERLREAVRALEERIAGGVTPEAPGGEKVADEASPEPTTACVLHPKTPAAGIAQCKSAAGPLCLACARAWIRSGKPLRGWVEGQAATLREGMEEDSQ